MPAVSGVWMTTITTVSWKKGAGSDVLQPTVARRGEIRANK